MAATRKRKAASPVSSPQETKRSTRSKDAPTPAPTPSKITPRKSRVSNVSTTATAKKNLPKAAPKKSRLSTASISTTRSRGGTAASVLALNEVPSLKHKPLLDVFVFGTGSMCELGLGPDGQGKIVKRPRSNPLLAKLPIVDIAVGGMHAAALANDGVLYTWGVNDQGALGRDTKWDGGNVDADADSDDEADMMNPYESTPTPVETDVRFVKVAASDSVTVGIDEAGGIWAWGTFRCSDGILGFSTKDKVAARPVKLELKATVVDLACGTDHILALTSSGKVFAWGNGQQFQLGRKVVERTRMNGLVPREFGLKKIVMIGAGSYHSFAKDVDGHVYAWGLNQFGQCGVEIKELGEDGAVVSVPTLVEGLSGKDVIQIAGGEHHSVAITSSGEVLVWGRLDASQLGIARTNLPENTVNDQHGKPRYIPTPTHLDLPVGGLDIGCGTHHNVLIDQEHKAWSWGFGESYQVGQGPPGEDVEVPTRIENTATANKHMVHAGAGGQFSVLCSIRNDQVEDKVTAQNTKSNSSVNGKSHEVHANHDTNTNTNTVATPKDKDVQKEDQNHPAPTPAVKAGSHSDEKHGSSNKPIPIGRAEEHNHKKDTVDANGKSPSRRRPTPIAQAGELNHPK